MMNEQDQSTVVAWEMLTSTLCLCKRPQASSALSCALSEYQRKEQPWISLQAHCVAASSQVATPLQHGYHHFPVKTVQSWVHWMRCFKNCVQKGGCFIWSHEHVISVRSCCWLINVVCVTWRASQHDLLHTALLFVKHSPGLSEEEGAPSDII